MIIKLSEANPSLIQIKDEYEPMTVIDKHADNSKTKRDLGYYDSMSLEEALGITIEWARTFLGKE
jgi:nucleoside-diphosphate-sugar epimerase